MKKLRVLITILLAASMLSTDVAIARGRGGRGGSRSGMRAGGGRRYAGRGGRRYGYGRGRGWGYRHGYGRRWGYRGWGYRPWVGGYYGGYYGSRYRDWLDDAGYRYWSVRNDTDSALRLLSDKTERTVDPGERVRLPRRYSFSFSVTNLDSGERRRFRGRHRHRIKIYENSDGDLVAR